MKKLLIFTTIVLMFSFSFLFAQEQTGELEGTVKLNDGTPLPGVTVEAESPSLIGTATALTDESGRFRLVSLPPGTYTITFSLPGFTTIERKDIEVLLGRTLRVDITLSPAEIEETIIVRGESPVVDVRKSSTTINITKEMFTKLPKGRDFTSVVTVTAGVNDEIELQGISMDGASSSENMFFVDGVNTTHLYTGDSAQQVLFEFIDEVQVKSSGYAAEYGGSMGGVINVVTRSGGNEFHGELMGYYNGSMTNGTPRKVLRINPLDNTEAQYIEYADEWVENKSYKEDTWHNYEFGFGIGGYIVKDRLWFFGSYLPTTRSIDRDAHFLSDPTKDATFNQKRYWYRASGKLTAQIFSNLRMSASFAMDPYKWRGELPPMDGSGNPEKDWGKYGYDYPGITAAGRADYIVSDNLFLSATGGYFRTNVKQLVGPTEPRWFFRATNAGIPGVPPELVRARYWYNYGYYDGYQTRKNIQDRTTATVDGTYYFDLGGEHVFKAGVQFERIHQDVDDAYPYTYYRLYWGYDYHSPNLGTVPTTYGYLEARDPFGVLAEIHSDRWAIFLQDSWTIGDKLTLNVGVRFEKEDIPSFASPTVLAEYPQFGEPPVTFDFLEKAAPRFGFAYDVYGDASLKVFGSVGIYYDVMKLEMAEGSYGGFQWISSYYDMTTLDWTTFGEYDHPVTDGSFLPYFESLNWRIPSYETTQPDMKPYSKIEYTFGFQKRVTEDVSISMRGLHNRILWAIEDIGIQTPEGEQYFNGNPGSDWVNKLWAPGYWPTPKAKRNYYSVDIGIDKRFSNNWMGGAHYTWSYLWGNFSGLASSDEQGRKSPNVERYFDAWFMHYTQDGKESTGKLPTDRPHQFKFYGAYTFDFGLTVGAYFYGMSGTPKSLEFELNNIQGYYPIGRGTEGRNPFLWRLDLYAEYNIKLTDRYTAQINLNVENAFDTAITTRHWHLINQEDVYITDAEIMAHFDYRDVIATHNVLLDPRYMKPWSFQGPISARIGVKFIF
ncbi:MAG: carboxypeptidase regulatory-like domain-containing protein [Candidatus Aminicenantia bacterium]